jgi:hypothetical protein
MHLCRGNFGPLTVIFARQRIKADLTDGAPPGTSFTCNMGGRMRLDVFVKDFDIF